MAAVSAQSSSMMAAAWDPDLLFLGCGAAFFALRGAEPDATVSARFLAVATAALAGWALWDRQVRRRAAEAGREGSLEAIERDGLSPPCSMREALGTSMGGGAQPDPDLYNLHVTTPTPGNPMRALRRRPVMAKLVSSLLPYMAGNRGLVTRVSVALEDFFARIDTLSGPRTPAAAVARNLGILHDDRAEALNALASLQWAHPPHAGGQAALRRATRVIRRATLAEVRTLVDRHATAPEVQAAEWRPPYPRDSQKDDGRRLYI